MVARIEVDAIFGWDVERLYQPVEIERTGLDPIPVPAVVHAVHLDHDTVASRQ